jgi:PAS domain S-box-containing protein
LTRTEKARGGSKPIRMLIGNAIVTALLLVGMCLYGVKSGADARQSETADARLRELDGQIALYDEVLTMSALTGVATGDRQWEERYNRTAPKLDAAIGEVRGRTGCIDVADPIRATDVANVKLVGLETLAFRLARDGRRDTAMTLLLGGEYATLKRQYAAGMAGVTAEITKHVTAGSRRRAQSFAFGSLAMVLLLIAVWLGSFRVTRRFITEQRQAQSALRERVKELDCLFGMARLIEKPGIAVDELAQGVMNLLAGAMQYPEAAEARVRVGEKEYQTPNWDGTTLRIQEPIRLEGVETGAVELGYPPSAGKSSPSFVPEEHNLLSAVAERLGRILERMHTAAALRGSEERMRTITGSAKDAIIMMDDTGLVTFWNPAAEAMFGYAATEAIGRKLHEFLPAERFRAAHQMAFPRFCATGEGGAVGRTVELAAIRKDGAEIPAELSLSAIKVDDEWHAVGIVRDITERKQAEVAMRAVQTRREQLENIVGRSPAVAFLWRTDEQLTVDFVSSNVSQFGYEPEEFLNGRLHYAAIVHPEDRDRAVADAARHVAAGTSEFVQEYRILTKTGEQRWVEDHTWVPRDSDGTITHHQGIIVDVTERKLAEAEVAQLSQRNQLILNAAGEGIIGLDSTGRCTFVNPAAIQMLGFDLNELVGHKLHALTHHTRANGEPYPPEECPIYRAFNDGLTHEAADELFWRKDGTSFPVEYSSTPVREGGRLAGAVVTFKDITERKQAEAALAESELTYRRVFESSNDAMMLLDSEKFLDCNDATLRVFGYSTRDEFLGKHPGQVSPPLQADGRESRVAADEKMVTAVRDGRNFFEWLHQRADGTVFPADVLLTPLDYHGRKVLQATVRDITPRKIAEVEIAQKNAELAKLNELKNQLLGMAAHDLRNPLTVVNTASSFLLDDASRLLSEEKKHDFMRRINANGEFMLRLIDNLLDVAKIESGRLDLELATGDLCGLIEENLTMNRMLAEKKSIRLDFAPERGVPLFRFDRGKVEQVLNNLISNALKFSAPDTVVTVQASRVNGTVVVSVRDHGQGIPAEELDKLFKPFSKTSVRGTAGEKSTGLGLAICRKIVEGHHGRIWAESEPGKGSTFSFVLPAAGKEQS